MFFEDLMLKLKIFLANSLTRTTRSAALCGIIAAVTGPYFLFAIGGSGASNLPWHVWTITLLLTLLVIGRGQYMFMLDSQEAEAISISPRRR